ncbi:hypothetical protein V5O48_006248 [Marasmius crinis-equi]|uniref:Uncharacterized protein n=1 Tax=Marasmius crinis-equi TaxID=585013 RepID=A0ABR3FK18_9AGAR
MIEEGTLRGRREENADSSREPVIFYLWLNGGGYMDGRAHADGNAGGFSEQRKAGKGGDIAWREVMPLSVQSLLQSPHDENIPKKPISFSPSTNSVSSSHDSTISDRLRSILHLLRPPSDVTMNIPTPTTQIAHLPLFASSSSPLHTAAQAKSDLLSISTVAQVSVVLAMPSPHSFKDANGVARLPCLELGSVQAGVICDEQSDVFSVGE